MLFAVLTLVVYFYALPQFTYRQVVVELSSIHSEERFASIPNVKYQKLAPKMHDGRVSYYCYVLETNGKSYYFDQHTGSYGRVTTDPESVL